MREGGRERKEGWRKEGRGSTCGFFRHLEGTPYTNKESTGLTATRLNSKVKCLFTTSATVREKVVRIQKEKQKIKRERWRLISLSFTKTKVETDRRKRCCVHSPNATQIRIHKNNKDKTPQSYLYDNDSQCVQEKWALLIELKGSANKWTDERREKKRHTTDCLKLQYCSKERKPRVKRKIFRWNSFTQKNTKTLYCQCLFYNNKILPSYIVNPSENSLNPTVWKQIGV